MENGKTITGIVVGKKNLIEYFVWSNETYVGKDGIITVTPEHPVKTGDWVSISFTKEDALKYFPNIKTSSTPQFESENYIVIPAHYETIVDGRTIRVKLDYFLMDNQEIIEHHFFGKIYNNRHTTSAGKWNITIVRTVPKPPRESVWVLEKIDQVSEKEQVSEHHIIGIIVGYPKNNPNEMYIWCKERPIGMDLVINKNGQDLELGTWIRMTFSSYEIENCFPRTLFYRCQKYSIIPPIHPTEVLGGRNIMLKLNCWIRKNEENIWHPFVGTIINDKNYSFDKSGIYSIPIVRGDPRHSDFKSVWFLKEPQLIEEDKSEEVTPPPVVQNVQVSEHHIIGIVVAQDTNQWFVWCKERPPGMDLVINKSGQDLKIGMWIRMRFTNDEMEHCFPSFPKYQCQNYSIITQMHDTRITGGNNVKLNLTCWIRRNEESIWHPFVGAIINDKNYTFDKSGKYSIPIVRASPKQVKDGNGRSVWFLKEPKLIEADESENATNVPVQAIPQTFQISGLENQLSHALSFENLVNNLDEFNPRSPSPNPPAPARYSHLQQQLKNYGSQSEQCLTAQKIAHHPTPAPRISLESSSQRNLKKAIITKINKVANREHIYVWLLEEHKEGILRLNVDAEKFGLEVGSVFKADFRPHGEGETFQSIGPVSDVGELYPVRPNDKNGYDIRIYAENLRNVDSEHKYPWIQHEHFGDVFDNRRQLQNHVAIKYHMWIRKALLDSTYRWVVVEQISV